jgi:hypothetical protein
MLRGSLEHQHQALPRMQKKQVESHPWIVLDVMSVGRCSLVSAANVAYTKKDQFLRRPSEKQALVDPSEHGR